MYFQADTACFVYMATPMLPAGKRKYHLYHFGTLFADFLGHFPSRTSYDVSVKHESSFLCLYNYLKKISTTSYDWNVTRLPSSWKAQGVCSALSACTASVKWVLAIWVVFTRYFMDSVLIQILLVNSCLIFVLFFIT